MVFFRAVTSNKVSGQWQQLSKLSSDSQPPHGEEERSHPKFYKWVSFFCADFYCYLPPFGKQWHMFLGIIDLGRSSLSNV